MQRALVIVAALMLAIVVGILFSGKPREQALESDISMDGVLSSSVERALRTGFSPSATSANLSDAAPAPLPVAAPGPDEQELRLTPVTPPPAQAAPASALDLRRRADQVRVDLERAQAVRPDAPGEWSEIASEAAMAGLGRSPSPSR